MEIIYHNDTGELVFFNLVGGHFKAKIATSAHAASSNDKDVGEKQNAQINFQHKLIRRTDAVMMVFFSSKVKQASRGQQGYFRFLTGTKCTSGERSVCSPGVLTAVALLEEAADRSVRGAG